MTYKWIRPEKIQLNGKKEIILFGGGKGTEEFLDFAKKEKIAASVVAIADNDPSLVGKSLKGIKIINPQALIANRHALIIVTSVSGRETIALQLEQMGLACPADFILIGRYPEVYQTNFNLLNQWLTLENFLPGSRCLHVGPGGFLGLESLLWAGGAQKVSAIDKYSFGIVYPEISEQIDSYLEIENFLIEQNEKHGKTLLDPQRFSQLFISQDEKTSFNQDLLAYHHPIDVEQLPFADDSFDFVCSFAVLEHVRNHERAVKELTRITRQGGINFHRIITSDHRSYSSITGFNHFSFREHSDQDWESITRAKFYQNRLLPGQWKQLFDDSGCPAIRYEEDMSISLTAEEIRSFHPNFRGFSPRELGAVNCTLLAKKGLNTAGSRL